MLKSLLLPIVPGLLFSAVAAGAAQAGPANIGFVREHAIVLLEGALTPDQTTTLQLIAHQAAIANVCEGFTVDENKFGTVFETLAPVDAAKMSDEQKAYHDKHIMVIYGVLVGGELSEIALDVPGACAAASTELADPDLAALSVLK